jgi:hypothetical protein
MFTKRNIFTLAAVAVVVVALGFGQNALDNDVQAQTKEAPMFEVDPFWPKPLPNQWILGATIGLDVDSRDHVYIIHRRDTFNERTEIGAATDPVKSDCCIPAPNVLEFDPEGNLVNHWGGPGDGYDWPASNHGITVDHKDNQTLTATATKISAALPKSLLMQPPMKRTLLTVTATSA